jgi:hypothetical protein
MNMAVRRKEIGQSGVAAEHESSEERLLAGDAVLRAKDADLQPIQVQVGTVERAGLRDAQAINRSG